MSVGVFDDGLKDHGGNKSIVEMGVNLHLLSYAPGKSAVLHGQIHLDKLHLVAQRNELRIASLEGDTQEAAELFQHEIRSFHIAVHETRDTVHRIEKKVRIELHAQGSHLRLNKLRLQLRGRKLLLAILLVVTNSSEEEEGRPEDNHAVDDFCVKLKCEAVPERHGRTSQGDARKDHDPDHLFDDTEHDAKWQENRENRAESCVVDLRTELPPDNPTEYSPKEILHGPGGEEQTQIDVVVPKARTGPLLQGEETTEQNRTRDEDGRMHENGLTIVFFPEFQVEDPRLSDPSSLPGVREG